MNHKTHRSLLKAVFALCLVPVILSAQIVADVTSIGMGGYYGNVLPYPGATASTIAPFLAISHQLPASFPSLPPLSSYFHSFMLFGEPFGPSGSSWRIDFDPQPYFNIPNGGIFPIGKLTVFNGTTTDLSSISAVDLTIQNNYKVNWGPGFDPIFPQRYERVTLNVVHTPNMGFDVWQDADAVKLSTPFTGIFGKALWIQENKSATVDILVKTVDGGMQMIGFGDTVTGDGIVLPLGESPVPEPQHAALAVGVGLGIWAAQRKYRRVRLHG